MRYRGGGIGHLYMRETEQWLNSSNWGSSWPTSLKSRDPNPDQEPLPQNNSGAAAMSTQDGGYKSDSTEEDAGEDSDGDGGELADEDTEGEDLEHPEEEEDDDTDEEEDEDEDADVSQPQVHHMGRARRARKTTEGDGNDEAEEAEEDFEGDMEDFGEGAEDAP